MNEFNLKSLPHICTGAMVKQSFCMSFVDAMRIRARITRFIQMVSKTSSLQELTRTMCLRLAQSGITSNRISVCTSTLLIRHPRHLYSIAKPCQFLPNRKEADNNNKTRWNTPTSKNERNDEEKRVLHAECPMFKPQI